MLVDTKHIYTRSRVRMVEMKFRAGILSISIYAKRHMGCSNIYLVHTKRSKALSTQTYTRLRRSDSHAHAHLLFPI